MTNEQKIREILDAMPAWAVPIWFRAGDRIIAKMPLAEVERLARQEFAAEQAKQHNLTVEE